VLSSTLVRDDPRRPAHAQLEARVSPDKLDAFLKQVSALGSVGQHSKTAEDKTDEVIDTDARLKNMSEFVEMNSVYGEFFRESPPARATVEVARLPRDVSVEIDCIAVME